MTTTVLEVPSNSCHSEVTNDLINKKSESQMKLNLDERLNSDQPKNRTENLIQTVPNVTELSPINSQFTADKSLTVKNNIWNETTKCHYDGCQVIFSDYLELIEHRRTHPRYQYNLNTRWPQKLKCPFEGCNALLNSRSGIIYHRNIHFGKFKCHYDGCDYNASSGNALKRHQLLH